MSIYSATTRRRRMFLGKRMSTNKNYRSKQNTKNTQVIEEMKLSKKIDEFISLLVVWRST